MAKTVSYKVTILFLTNQSHQSQTVGPWIHQPMVVLFYQVQQLDQLLTISVTKALSLYQAAKEFVRRMVSGPQQLQPADVRLLESKLCMTDYY